jgi:peptidoglycan/xylan/chitin deacetylase (PgdA/CDA1 family)
MCLSRRSFTYMALAAAVPVPDAIVEPMLRVRVPPDAPRTVALTLDACSGATDWRILTVLAQLAVPATIFASGLWLRGNAEAIAWLKARPALFSLQNHGARHLPAVLGTRRIYGLPVAGTRDGITAEVAGGSDAIIQHFGAAPAWYRCAAARYSAPAIGLIQSMGFAIAGFSRNADAGASLPPAVVARRIAAAVSGDVIIAHVNQPGRASGAGVAAGIQALHQAGAIFVKLTDQATELDAYSQTAGSRT